MSASRQDSFSALLPSDDETPVETTRKDKKNSRYAGTLGKRLAGLEPATFSVRSHSPSQTGADIEGQGETKQRFCQKSRFLRGTGRDRERHPIAVGLRSNMSSTKGGITPVRESS